MRSHADCLFADETTDMTKRAKSNVEMQKVTSSLKLSAAEVNEIRVLGVSAEDLKVIGSELAPLHARLHASVPGSTEENEAADALVRAILRDP